MNKHFFIVTFLVIANYSFVLAQKSEIILTQPDFPQSKAEIKQRYHDFINYYHVNINNWLAIPNEDLTFKNTILFLEDMGSQAGDLFGILGIVENAFPQAELRKQAHKTSLELEKFILNESYREDIYLKTKDFLDTKPQLSPLEQRLADDILNDYKRIGLHLSKDKQKKTPTTSTGA